MSAIPRILDANFNRAREALRVMEDAARFALNDAQMCEQLKTMRHDLRTIIDKLPLHPGALEASRDVEGDVGTAITTDDEAIRGSLVEVVIAAGKRLGESLRVIEEMCKVIDPTMSAPIERLRYDVYTIEQKIQLRLGTGRPRQWKSCLILTKSLCKRPWRDVLRGAISGGAECVQVREKDMDDRELLAHVRDVMDLASSGGATAAVIVNDHVDIALAAGADGVHLGELDLSIEDARRVAGRELIIGASTHDLREADMAVQAGADYCGVGAMFPSMLKPDRTPSGPAFLRSFIDCYPQMPHLAIGGITIDNIHSLVEAGARGIAVSTAICAADDPEAAARSLREAMETAAVRA